MCGGGAWWWVPGRKGGGGRKKGAATRARARARSGRRMGGQAGATKRAMRVKMPGRGGAAAKRGRGRAANAAAAAAPPARPPAAAPPPLSAHPAARAKMSSQPTHPLQRAAVQRIQPLLHRLPVLRLLGGVHRPHRVVQPVVGQRQLQRRAARDVAPRSLVDRQLSTPAAARGRHGALVLRLRADHSVCGPRRGAGIFAPHGGPHLTFCHPAGRLAVAREVPLALQHEQHRGHPTREIRAPTALPPC